MPPEGRRPDGAGGSGPAFTGADTFALPEHWTGTDIWHVELRGDSGGVERHARALSEDEKRRAGEFRFERDVRRYVIAHGALRDILAKYVMREAGDLRFSVTSSGKPVLAPRGDSADLMFSLAHAADIALIAVSRACEVGIDVEQVNPELDLRSIARRCFSANELERLRADPPTTYVENFFTFWTRKEAYVKGIGEGLSAPLTEIDVSAAPAHPGGDWVVRDVPVRAGYKGAIATRGGPGPGRTFTYEDLAP